MVTVPFTYLAAGVAVALVAVFVAYWKGKADGVEQAQRSQSREAHEDAAAREPPVDVGDHVSLGVKEFKSHHSGKQVAVCKQEGFVIFVEGVPSGVDVGDVIDAKIVSFGRERTSAEAEYVG